MGIRGVKGEKNVKGRVRIAADPPVMLWCPELAHRREGGDSEEHQERDEEDVLEQDRSSARVHPRC